MKVYVKNETNLLKGGKNLDKKLREGYHANFTVGVYELEINSLEKFNMFVRDIIKTMGSTSVYPFITPYEGSFQINLRLLDMNTRSFK